MADALASGASEGNLVGVQVPPRPLGRLSFRRGCSSRARTSLLRRSSRLTRGTFIDYRQLSMKQRDALIDDLKVHYGAAARRAGTGRPAVDECSPVGSSCYDPAELANPPIGAVAGSIGWANPG